MTYRVGTSFKFSPEPAQERESMEWAIGTQITFATILDDVRIFVPKLMRRRAMVAS